MVELGRVDPRHAAAIRAALAAAPEGMGMAELAEATGIPRSTVNRAVQQMRDQLRQRQRHRPERTGRARYETVYRLPGQSPPR